MEKSEIQAFIDSLGIEYKALFVPFSQSRNAKEKHLSLNWLVTLSKGNQTLTTDYMQGIAHLPNYASNLARNASYSDYVAQCVQTGKYAKNVNGKAFFQVSQLGTSPIPSPALIDILYSLVVDSDVIEYSSFEEWASNYGYEQDSRQAEKIYRACLETALKLKAMLGNENLQKLREAYQDY